MRIRFYDFLVGFCLVHVLCVFLVVVSSVETRASEEKHSFKPEHGFVPDQRTAIRIAEAVLIPIYGEAQIKSQRPFSAKLEKDIWIVEGSLPEGMHGGVAVVEISKQDGRVLRVSHGK